MNRLAIEKTPFDRQVKPIFSYSANARKPLYVRGYETASTEVAGVGDYEAVMSASQVVHIDGQQARVISIDALIESKRAMSRPKDRVALSELQAIRDRRRNMS